jgi:squalene-hopene/tetraprenyl-beta-curcumene cyclase
VLEGSRAAGGAKDPEFYKKALVFLNRLQNHSETNDQTYEVDGKKVVPGNDGGAFYQPNVSKAGVQELEDGTRILRSYGSMSYALLKCYLLCDIDHRNDRVRAVVAWLTDHWDLSKNPGMEHAEGETSELMGLFYYYLTIGRTLTVCEAKGVPLEGPLAGWRESLARAVVARQGEDGSWVNPQDRWWEGNPALVTAYALLALDATLP